MDDMYEAVRKAILESRGELDEKTNPYAIGMAAAEKSTGDRPPLKKSTIVKAHRIAKKIQAKEEVEDLGEAGLPDYSKHSTAALKTLLQPGILRRSESHLKRTIRSELKKRSDVKEEVEDLDEGIATYDKKGKLVGNYKDLETAKKIKPGHHYAPKGTVFATFDRVGKPVWAPTFKEEVEQDIEIVEGIEVSTSTYEFSHGKKPKGSGGWMFSPHKNPDMKTQKDDVFSTHGSYTDAKKKAAAWAKGKGHRTIHALPEEVELDEGIAGMSDARLKYHATKGISHGRYTPKEIKDEHNRRRRSVPNYHTVKASLEEEVELDEARGRPKKDKGYTVHPVTKELLHHDNPAHMARIKVLQKNGILPKEKKEPSEHIINRMGQAATNMTGGQHIKYDNGKTHHVSNSLASRTLAYYRGLKPADKEKFQDRIAQSHEDHLDALQGK